MTSTYDKMKELVELERLDDSQWRQLWRLLDNEERENTEEYRKVWLGLLEQNPQHFECIWVKNIRSIEMVLEVIPFATFGLRPGSPIMEGGSPMSNLDFGSSLFEYVHELEIVDQSIERSSLADLASSQYVKNVHTLTMSNVRMTNDVAEVFVNSNLEGIRKIDLSASHLSAEGVCHMLSSKAFMRLKYLSLSNCGISLSEGSGDIIKCICKLRSLEHLNMSTVRIGNDGAEALAQAEMKQLQYLNLSFSGIGDVGAAALAMLGHQMKSLKHVNLEGNQIGESGRAVLQHSPYSSRWEVLKV